MARAQPFRSHKRPAASRKPKGSPGKRCYAIGDVHGRLDLLQELFDLIEQHDAERPDRETVIVLLGDLIDRGPHSSGVIDFVRTYRPVRARVYLVAGNHEELMLRALHGDATAFQLWMTSGGEATARSYGVDISSLEGIGLENMARRLSAAIPASHIAFLRSAADSIRFGDYLLTHAGVRPGVALEDQTVNDLHWIREPFLTSDFDHGFVVVHGHSAQPAIEERANRVGVDTGAHRTGILTAVWIEDEKRGFLQAVGASSGVVATVDSLVE
jgi:serine/threonine protein phosphatase 1